jgi:hypothetical protein
MPGLGSRQNYLPVRKPALWAALKAMPAAKWGADGLGRFVNLLSALIHHEYFARLESLREGYATLAQGQSAGVEAFAAEFEVLMARANFEQIPPEEMAACDREAKAAPVRTQAPKWHYEIVKFYRRGLHQVTETHERTWPLKDTIETLDAYDDVVVFIQFRKPSPSGKRQRALPAGVKPGSLLIKSFASIPVRDLCMLYPDLRIRMTRADAIMLGAPALLGGIPILISLSSALGVILLVLGALLGYGGTVDDSQMMQAIGALTALAGAGAFLFRQYNNYTLKKLKYQKRIADSVYYHNIANQAGVFENLIGAAEDQEVKEAVLAYAFLLQNGAMTKENLDAAIEDWLRSNFAEDIDFQIGDALDKLARLGLATRSGPFWSCLPLDRALAALDARWDNLYDSKGATVPARPSAE